MPLTKGTSDGETFPSYGHDGRGGRVDSGGGAGRSRSVLVLERRWPVLGDQAAARAAAGLPPATFREQAASLWRYARLTADRRNETVRPVRSVAGLEHGHAVMQNGPVLVSFPHIGQFEAAGALLYRHYPGRKVTVITDNATTPGAPAVTLQRRYGWEPVAVDDPAVAAAAYLCLHRGDVLAVTTDVMPPGQEPCTVEFLGRLVQMPAGPARLVVETGAAVLPLATFPDHGGVRVDIRPPIWLDDRMDVAGITQELADINSDLICDAPDVWYPPFPMRSPDAP